MCECNSQKKKMVSTMCWTIIYIVIITVTLPTWAKEFLTTLRNGYNTKFNKGLTKTIIDKTKSTKKALKILETDKRDRDLFREFHKDIALPECKELECQSTLANGAVAHLNVNKIPFNNTEVTREECRQVYELPVPKNMCEWEMGEADIPQRLMNRELDYLHYSTLSVPSIDQLGCRSFVYAGIGK